MTTTTMNITAFDSTKILLEEFPKRCVDYKFNPGANTDVFLDLDCMIHSQVLAFKEIVVYLAVILLIIMASYDLINWLCAKYLYSGNEDISSGLINFVISTMVLIILYYTGMFSFWGMIGIGITLAVFEWIIQQVMKML